MIVYVYNETNLKLGLVNPTGKYKHPIKIPNLSNNIVSVYTFMSNLFRNDKGVLLVLGESRAHYPRKHVV